MAGGGGGHGDAGHPGTVVAAGALEGGRQGDASRRGGRLRACVRIVVPAEHWIHLRDHQPDRVDLRDRQAAAARSPRGPGSAAAGIAMAFKLIESAQARWRAVNAPHLVALVRAGAKFENGKLIERADESGGHAHAAWHADPQVLTYRSIGVGV